MLKLQPQHLPVWQHFVSRLKQKTDRILELIALADYFNVKYLQESWESVLPQIFTDPAWYNRCELPRFFKLPYKTSYTASLVKKMIEQAPFNRIIMQDPAINPTIIRHNAKVSSAAFSLDGTSVVTASNDGTARIITFGIAHLSIKQVLAVATLVQLVSTMRTGTPMHTPLYRPHRLENGTTDQNCPGSWVYNAYQSISGNQRARLEQQWPEIRSIISQAIEQPVEAEPAQ